MSVSAICAGEVKSQIANAPMTQKTIQKRHGAHLSIELLVSRPELEARASNSSCVIRDFQSETMFAF